MTVFLNQNTSHKLAWPIFGVSGLYIKPVSILKTRPKPPYGRQGLAGYLGKGNIFFLTNKSVFLNEQIRKVSGGVNKERFSSHPKDVTLPKGDPADLLWSKNVTFPTGRSIWPPLIQKRDRYQQGVQLTTFWSKNVTVTNREVQLTTFDPKTWPFPTGGPTDHLWSKNVTVKKRGVQLTF